MIDEKYLTENTSVFICGADGTVRFAHNERAVRKSASLIKLFIAEAALRSGIPLSERIAVPKKAYLGNSILSELKQPEVTLYEALAAMLACSDNTATNLLIERLGGFGALNAAFCAYGAQQTAVNRKMLDFKAAEAGRDNLTTAADCVACLRRLCADPTARRLLAMQKDRERLLRYILCDVHYMGKSGDIEGVFHDAGAFDAGRERVFAAVLTVQTERSAAKRLAGQAGLLAYGGGAAWLPDRPAERPFAARRIGGRDVRFDAVVPSRFCRKIQKKQTTRGAAVQKNLFHMETIVSRQPSAAGRLTAHLYRHRWPYLLAALLFALCILPLALVPMPKGHDILFHLNRIDALSAEIEAGNIPARIYHTVYGGVGYASGMFYGDWLLYFPAWLVTAGVGVVTAYKLNVMLVTVMTLLIAFFCAKAAFGDDRSAFTAAVTYGFSGYFAIDTYTRAAVGEMTAFAFVPLVFLGLWSILCGDKKKWLCLPVGLTFLLVSHVLSAFAAVLLCAVFFLCYLGRVIKEPRRHAIYQVRGARVRGAVGLVPVPDARADGERDLPFHRRHERDLLRHADPAVAAVVGVGVRFQHAARLQVGRLRLLDSQRAGDVLLCDARRVRALHHAHRRQKESVRLSVFLGVSPADDDRAVPVVVFAIPVRDDAVPVAAAAVRDLLYGAVRRTVYPAGADEKRVGGFLHPVRLLLAVFVRFDRERLDSQLRQLRREWHRDHLQLQGQHRRGRISALLRFESAVLPLVSVQPSGQGDDEQRFSRHAEGRARAWQRLGRLYGKRQSRARHLHRRAAAYV
ncbi:MAG: serine hydrolase [Acutalibacteraceae bacterium]